MSTEHLLSHVEGALVDTILWVDIKGLEKGVDATEFALNVVEILTVLSLSVALDQVPELSLVNFEVSIFLRTD